MRLYYKYQDKALYLKLEAKLLSWTAYRRHCWTTEINTKLYLTQIITLRHDSGKFLNTDPVTTRCSSHVYIAYEISFYCLVTCLWI